ncbi:MAG: hypothetical protein VXY27_05310, partial [Thermoproteota archaeon]|nr:hypothetical protein [Thermoproteota archaeon]
ASNVDSATVVRLYNNHSAALLITRKDSGGTTIGSLTVNSKDTVILEKDYTDTLTAANNGATVKVTKVGFTIS